MQINIQSLEKAFSDMLQKDNISLTLDSDLREYIKDSIDLGEVLAILGVEIDLGKFQSVYTVEDFLKVINQKYE